MTQDQARELEAFNRGFEACKQEVIAICKDEQAIASLQQNLTIEGMAHGAERCRKRIERLGSPQEQGVVSN